MLLIEKTGEGYYLVKLALHITELGRNECHSIKKELSEIVKPHREITVDLKGINNITTGGLKILQDLKHFTDTKNCQLRFINSGESIIAKIREITGKKLTKGSESGADDAFSSIKNR